MTLFGLMVWMFIGGSASAQSCPTIAGGSAELARLDASARIHFVDQSMKPARRAAKRWFWGWTVGFSSLTAGQLAMVPLLDDPEQKRVLAVGAGSTVLGVGFLVIAPPEVISYDRRLARLPTGRPVGCEGLAQAEQLLLRASKMERFGQGWFMHGGNVLLNTGAGLILGLGWQHWESAWLTTVVGILVGEAMIWTQPMDATRALERYRTGAWTGHVSHRALLHVHPLYVRAGAGVGLSMRI